MMCGAIVRWNAFLVLFLSGCSLNRPYPAPLIFPTERLVGINEPSSEDFEEICSERDVPSAPKNILVLSGGGMNGAFTAGVLKGWTDAGSRPQFDVVTGISTGALIGPYAFLGPKYDAELERLYTSMRQGNIFRPRLLLFDSLASSSPLESLIAAGTTPEVLSEIADAHRRGRRLYVGTTNLDTKRLVVWDLGAIAVRNTNESKTLFRRVLLASCSVPGLFPPVPIDIEIDGKRFTELHVDGSVTACAFLQPAMLGIGPDGALQPGAKNATVRVIVAGKLQQTASPTTRELFHIAGESLNTVIQAKTDGELTEMFLLARYANADFKLAGIPQNYPLSTDCMSFDPQTMRGLFDAGYRGGKEGKAWQSLPPGLEIEWFLVPRSDTRFVKIHKASEMPWQIPEQLKITLGTRDTAIRQ